MPTTSSAIFAFSCKWQSVSGFSYFVIYSSFCHSRLQKYDCQRLAGFEYIQTVSYMFFKERNDQQSSSESDYDDLPPVTSYRSDQKSVVPIAQSFLLLRKKDDYQDYEAFSRKKNAQSDAQSQNQSNGQHSNDNQRMNSAAGTEAARSGRRPSILIDQESQTRALFTEEAQDAESRYKELLDLELKKNRELEHRLFMREKVIIELRAQNQEKIENRRKLAKQNRSASPKLWASRTVRKIQEEIRILKNKYQRFESLKNLEKSKQKLKRQNTSLRHQNRKYQKFFKAFADSLTILNNHQQCGRDVKDVWACWKTLFPKVAQNIGK